MNQFTVVFDTNYLRSLGAQEYQGGGIPEKLRIQLERATHRGDSVAIVETVRLEFNAFLGEITKKANESRRTAYNLLTSQGYSITPEIEPLVQLDMLAVIRGFCPTCEHLLPTLEDYREAERRTSLRLPPLPSKPEAEEMRDRVIWCQSIRLARETGGPVLIVSNDEIFANGAKSEEGIRNQISIARSETDLDQRLGERPLNIQRVVDRLLLFSEQLAAYDVKLSSESIYAVNNLRNRLESDGSMTQRFSLVVGSQTGLGSPLGGQLSVVGDQVTKLILSIGDDRQLVLTRVISDELAETGRNASILRQREAIEELQKLVKGSK